MMVFIVTVVKAAAAVLDLVVIAAVRSLWFFALVGFVVKAKVAMAIARAAAVMIMMGLGMIRYSKVSQIKVSFKELSNFMDYSTG